MCQVGGGGGGDEVEDEGSVDGGLLTGFELAEAFDVVVEASADFVGGGFGGEGSHGVERWVS